MIYLNKDDDGHGDRNESNHVQTSNVLKITICPLMSDMSVGHSVIRLLFCTFSLGSPVLLVGMQSMVGLKLMSWSVINYVDANLDEDKLFFDSKSGLRVSRVVGHQFQQSFRLVEPFAERRQLSVELHLVIGHWLKARSLGVAGRRAGDGERHGLHAATRHGHRLWAGRRRWHD